MANRRPKAQPARVRTMALHEANAAFKSHLRGIAAMHALKAAKTSADKRRMATGHDGLHPQRRR